MLRATIGHSLFLRFPDRDGWHEQRIERDLATWLPRISHRWPAKTNADTQHSVAKTASELARANVRGSLRSRFNDFLGSARAHELYLLDNILGDLDSRGAGPDADCAESPLAEVFMLALDSDDTYVKVPRDHVEAVEEFLAKIDEEPEKSPDSVGRPTLVVFPSRQPVTEEAHAS